jgi:subtilisin family serine protease
MHPIHPFWRRATLALALALSTTAWAVDKQRIEKEADIPRFSYTITEPLERVVRDKSTFMRVIQPVRADMESVLQRFEIADKSSQRQFLGSLVQLDFLAGNYDAALASADAVRALEEKPADKLLSGLRLRAMVAAAKQTGQFNTPAYFELVATNIRQQLDAMPFEVIANDVKSYKASAEMIGEGRILGGVQELLQATLSKTGALSSDFTPGLINARYALETAVPLKQTLISTFSAYLDQHRVEKTDIWAAREVKLSASGLYKTVNVAVWDSGVDTQLFPGQVVRNSRGQAALIAFDVASRPSSGELIPVPAAMRARMPEMLARTKGFSDLVANIDSPQASEVKNFMSTLKPEEFKPAMEQLGFSGNYVHGTHVAGITLNGNPWARLVTARLSFDYKLQPDPCPSLELAQRGAKAHQAYVDFFKRQQVRVVNMSWGGSVKDGEEALEKCGIGKSTDERQKIARTYFEIEKKALQRAFASAPGILFITAAGNSNSDSSFGEFIPSSIVLPNLLTVGAVDKAGDEAPFTSYGPTVVVHANGYQVDSYIPGGARVALSGTSMAAPNVANLAAKLLAAKPSLKPTEVIAIIRETADKSADGRRVLINPAKAMARVI